MPYPVYKWGVYAFGIALAILLADLLFLSFELGCNQPQVNAGAGEFGDRPVPATLFKRVLI